MRTFRYLAYAADGKRAAGVIIAETEQRAAEQLRSQGLHPAEVTPQDGRGGAHGLLARLGPGRTQRLSRDIRSVFLRQMAVLLGAGLPAEAALDAVRASGTLTALDAVAAEAKAALLDGRPLSEALERADPGMPRHVTAAIRAGESTGTLAAVFEELASYMETVGSERSQLATALIYPAFVAAVSLLVCGILMVNVAPEIVAMFEVTGRPLPQLTRSMLGISDWIGANRYALAAGAVVLVLTIAVAGRNPRIRDAWVELLLRLPIAGRLIRLNAAAQYLRTLALIIASRQTVLDAVISAAAVLQTTRFRAEAGHVAEAVRSGETLSGALRHLSPIPPVARQLVDAGEKSARLGQMTARAATLVETWQSTERKRFAAFIDPLLMMIVGAMVLVIVLSILLPIFDLQAAF